MKVVFLSDDFPPQSFGGAGISTYDLARGMEKIGSEVVVITTCRKREDESTFLYNGITIHRIQSSYHERWRAYVSLLNIPLVKKVEVLLRDLKPDVVHINNIHSHLSYYSCVLARRYARVVVFTARDTMSIAYGKLGTKKYITHCDPTTDWRDHIKEARLRYNPTYTFFARKCLARTDVRLAVSNSLRDALMKNGISKVQTMHTGLDVTEWGATDEEIQVFKKRYGIEGKKIVLHSGRLSPSKGSEKLIAAMEQVIHKLPEAVLVVAGFAGDYEARIKREFGDTIICTGWIDRGDMRISFAASDVVVVPSLYLDPFPRVVLEAMASKKPVIGSCYGGSPEAILDGETGYVVNPHDVQTMSEKIVTLLEDPKMSIQFGQSGYERIRTKFNLKEKIEQHVALYKQFYDEPGHEFFKE